MIVIDAYADGKLIKTLENMRARSDAKRCIHFKLCGRQWAATDKEPRQCIITAIRKNIAFAATEVYLCDDGDMYVLFPVLFGNGAREAIKDAAAALHILETKSFAEYFELPHDANRLRVQLKEKMEKRRQTNELLRKKSQQEQMKQKHQLVIHSTALRQSAEDIVLRRSEHNKPHVMIIDDDPFSRSLMENVLGGHYSFIMLDDAERALATYVSRAPDVLFLDINLPDASGHDLLEKIIAIDPHAYVVMFSGNSDQHNVAQAMKAGAKGVVAKPFTGGKLMQYIERCPTIRKNNFSIH